MTETLPGSTSTVTDTTTVTAPALTQTVIRYSYRHDDGGRGDGYLAGHNGNADGHGDSNLCGHSPGDHCDGD